MEKENSTHNTKKLDLYTLICSLVLIGAFLVILMISLLSEFGIHPDEFDVRACMDWCMNRLIWPDMRLTGEGLGDTYSLYGYTKVCNYTVYFLVMSKISFIFKLFMGAWPYFRMPNVLLALLMLIVCLKSLREKKYIMLGFGMCVQAWYIFSYVTADALDFVWAFGAVLILADEESILWKVIRGEYSKNKRVFLCIVLGLLYGMILLGKPYYYATLVLTFVVLLMYLIDVYNEELHKPDKTEHLQIGKEDNKEISRGNCNKRKEIWKTYILILGVAALVFVARYSLDLYYYGTDKAAASKQMMEIYANEDKKPSTPIEEQVQTYHAYEKGYPLSFIFEDDPKWFLKSYRSYVSCRITDDGDDWYFVLIGILYVAIYAWMGYELCSGDKKVRNQTLIFFIGTCLNIGGIIASIANSYLIDSQPQGRYLLPIALTTCYLGSRTKTLWENKVFCGLVAVAAVFSVAYFGLFDSRSLIDLSYVKTMLGM